jgi:predicted dehydrogenase
MYKTVERAHQRGVRIAADTALGPHYNFTRQARAFADAILTDTEPVITGEDGLRALEICLAIYEAAESGKVVKMSKE